MSITDDEVRELGEFAAARLRHHLALPAGRVDAFDQWLADASADQIGYVLDCAHDALCRTTLDEEQQGVAMQAVYAMFDAAKERGAERQARARHHDPQ